MRSVEREGRRTDSQIGRFLAGAPPDGPSDPGRRKIIGTMLLGGLTIAAAGASGLLFKELTSKAGDLTAEQRKALWLLDSANNLDVIENLKVTGARKGAEVIPAKLRNRPATETSDPLDFDRPGKIIDMLSPGTVIARARPVWGEVTSLGEKQKTRWLAVQLEDGRVGFVQIDGVEAKDEIYRMQPVDLATVPIPVVVR